MCKEIENDKDYHLRVLCAPQNKSECFRLARRDLVQASTKDRALDCACDAFGQTDIV